MSELIIPAQISFHTHTIPMREQFSVVFPSNCCCFLWGCGGTSRCNFPSFQQTLSSRDLIAIRHTRFTVLFFLSKLADSDSVGFVLCADGRWKFIFLKLQFYRFLNARPSSSNREIKFSVSSCFVYFFSLTTQTDTRV